MDRARRLAGRELTSDERKQYHLPLTARQIAALQAARLVESLTSKQFLKRDVIGAIFSDNGITDEVRREAVRQANEFWESGSLIRASWSVTKLPDQALTQYRQALAWAEAACQIDPDERSYLTTLGVAQYRVGQYEDAVTTLTRSYQIYSKQGLSYPSNIAFLAMSHYRLGRTNEAQKLLERLHQLLQGPRWQAILRFDRQALTLYNEAKAVIDKP